MTAQVVAALILLPFTFAFIYAGIHEYLRYKNEGRANYGLVYDEETGTTHVTGIAEGTEAYDPDDFDPRDANESETSNENDDDKA
ncbi:MULTISPECIES: hypothetical protein [Marivita]|uniref:Uncharacterized protein n=1 Tax=Marivita cryptomonadis TaxID=505252 RepID=A0A9Q2S5D1_9RHOB|nr:MULTISPECIES: hypothetical protein [Marivita]MCR9167649.1 hypothetical protein [Paracoccaceae bacterium]MBM2322054.1 hypothetical protein [Marivita cryptomonadis]MBM2331635.1 hypothetical protein [Marivita cryptomonadis]MBM2341220.1 hypothetical protein [Marivita cryptomonadis]MBM2345883.1 hypothetical protein [Marivita cryptomonadis]